MIETLNITRVHELAARMRGGVQQVIVGKDDVIDLALIALLCRGHVLVEDVPGIGKTTLARTLAQALGCTFKRIQFTPDLMPADVLGVNFYNQKTGAFEFQPGPVFSQVLLADEINRATPRTQSALLESMQEGQSTIDGETRQLPSPFLVLATQNPIEMEGTFPLPEAQLDRFMVRIKLGYPSPEEESDILLRFERNVGPPSVKAVTGVEELERAQAAVVAVRVDEVIRQYMVSLARATRSHAALALGASPRAVMALYKTSQARAAIDDREYVTPDDVKEMGAPVLAHRLILTSTSRLTGRSTEDVVADVLATVPVPVER
jgi:MoxR-like ATPase